MRLQLHISRADVVVDIDATLLSEKAIPPIIVVVNQSIDRTVSCRQVEAQTKRASKELEDSLKRKDCPSKDPEPERVYPAILPRLPNKPQLHRHDFSVGHNSQELPHSRSFGFLPLSDQIANSTLTCLRGTGPSVSTTEPDLPSGGFHSNDSPSVSICPSPPLRYCRATGTLPN